MIRKWNRVCVNSLHPQCASCSCIKCYFPYKNNNSRFLWCWVSTHDSDWLGTCYVDKAGLELRGLPTSTPRAGIKGMCRNIWLIWGLKLCKMIRQEKPHQSKGGSRTPMSIMAKFIRHYWFPERLLPVKEDSLYPVLVALIKRFFQSVHYSFRL